MSETFFDIARCPICAGCHRYTLAIERTVVLRMLTVTSLQPHPQQITPRKLRFTRLFTCPAKNEKFQATLVLTDTSDSPIKDVTVVGVAQDE